MDVPDTVERHRQVVLSERDDAASQPPHRALAHHGRFEVEPDPDAKPEHERTNPLPGRLIVGDGRVAFLSDTINQATYRALSTRADRDIPGEY